MKTLIVYSSITGNTRKLAEAIAPLMAGEKTLCAVDDAPPPEEFDVIAVGFWFQAGKPDLKAQKYMKDIGSGPRVFLFATHGAAAGSQHVKQAMDYARSLVPEARIMGDFSCPGQVSTAFLETAQKKDQPPPWLPDAPKAMGHPDDGDIKRLMEVVRTAMPDAVL